MTKTIIVTGASRGIGLAIVRSLLAQSSDTRVIGIARSRDALSAIAKESNGRFEFVAGSITEEGIRKKAVDMAGDKLDGLILNAGTADPIKRVKETEVKEIQQAFDINLFSQVDLIKLALPKLRAGKGRVIATTSGVAHIPIPGWAAYCSSKSALNMYMQVLAAEEPDLIVVAMEPGVVETGMVKDISERSRAAFGEEAYAMLQKEWDNMVQPEQPGEQFAKLALRAPKEFSGKVMQWNDKPVLNL